MPRLRCYKDPYWTGRILCIQSSNHPDVYVYVEGYLWTAGMRHQFQAHQIDQPERRWFITLRPETGELPYWIQDVTLGDKRESYNSLFNQQPPTRQPLLLGEP